MRHNFFYIKHESGFFDQSPLNIHPLLADIEEAAKAGELNLVLDSFSFDITSAFKIVELLKQKNVEYSVWLLSKNGSFSTIIALGAKEIRMTSFASLASVDATFWMHKFPLVMSLGTPWHLNPCEFIPWINYVETAVKSSNALVELERIDEKAFPSKSRNAAILHYNQLSHMMELYMHSQYRSRASSIADFFQASLGSFDSAAFFTELKKIGLNVYLMSDEELTTIENKVNINHV